VLRAGAKLRGGGRGVHGPTGRGGLKRRPRKKRSKSRGAECNTEYRPRCWVLPGLESGSCLSGSVRPLRLMVCEAAACLAIYVSVLPVTVAVPACIAVMYVRYTSHRAQALAIVFGQPIFLCRYVLVLSYRTITGNAPSGQSHFVIHLSVVLLPSPPPCCLERP
jgi:hypothetical protein